MDDPRPPSPTALPDPVPLAPRHEHVADGAHLVLEWEPVGAAERYRLQIAADPAFEEVVLEEEAPAGSTTWVVRRHFPEDDRTFFWRVRAGDGRGWSPGDRIESFISGSAPQVGHFADPDEAEPYGPLGALFSASTLEAAAELLPGRQPGIEARLGREHPEGVEAAEVVTLELGLLIAGAVVVVALLIILFNAC